jgi:hypothetical protein
VPARNPIGPDTLDGRRIQIELETLAHDPGKKAAYRMRLPAGGFLSVDEDIDATKGQFFYEAVDLASCVKYLDQVADPDHWNKNELERECASIELSEELWPGDEERQAWYQDVSPEGWPLIHAVTPWGSIARAIEQNLLQNDTSRRLDTVLLRTVTEWVDAACKYYQQVIQNREDRIAGLRDSWKKV